MVDVSLVQVFCTAVTNLNISHLLNLPRTRNLVITNIYISWKIKEDASILCDSEFRA